MLSMIWNQNYNTQYIKCDTKPKMPYMQLSCMARSIPKKEMYSLKYISLINSVTIIHREVSSFNGSCLISNIWLFFPAIS